MKKNITEYLQCSNCGSINKKRFWCNDDDLYIDNIKCDKCKKTVKHLRCGEHQEDIYLYYDCTLDFKFYNYDTK